MRHLFERFETIMMAAAFAEEGEFDSARQIMKESELRKTTRPSAGKRQRPDNRNELRAE
ncbi:MAG: hypothetical protein HQL09_08115 [Nitrospirae bacterium]|nr:hypothetical protein [Nitrospirota bacterium]